MLFSPAPSRCQGFSASVDHRADKLLALLGAERVLKGDDSRRLWRGVRDAEFLAEPRERAVWRVGVKPSRAVECLARLGPRALAHLFDCGGGLVWLSTGPTPADAAALRAALAPLGGHATLVRAPDALRAVVDVFPPQPPALMALTRRVKAAFDPDGVFNPGRMYRGI